MPTARRRSAIWFAADFKQANLKSARGRDCVATLSYVYDHASRELPKRLTKEFHDHHHLAQATLHVHINHDSCLEVTVLKGRSSEVKAFADQLIAERGVRHGHVTFVPTETDYGDSAHTHSHSHGAITEESMTVLNAAGIGGMSEPFASLGNRSVFAPANVAYQNWTVTVALVHWWFIHEWPEGRSLRRSACRRDEASERVGGRSVGRRPCAERKSRCLVHRWASAALRSS